MKRIFLFLSILLCSLSVSAQGAWLFNRGDSISWQPSQDMTITFEKDPAGFFWQNIKNSMLDVVRMPIFSGDGIVFTDTPFLQVEKNSFEVTNTEPRRFEVRLKTNIADWNSITCQSEAEWLRLVDTNGSQFPVITYMFEYDANYTGDFRETQIAFSRDDLSDVVSVISVGETATYSVSPKEITVTNSQDPRQFTVSLSSNVSEVLAGSTYQIIGNDGEWLRCVRDESNETGRTFTFDYEKNYTGNNREALVVFKSEQYNLSDTVKVISVGEQLTLEASPKEITVTNSQEPRQFTVSLSSNVSDVLTGSTYQIVGNDGEWLRCVSDESNETGRTFTFGYDQNYTGADREALVVFKSEQYNLSDTVKVISVGEQLTLEASPKEITVTNSQEPRQFTVSLSSNVIEVLAGSTYQIIGNDGEWLRCVRDESNETGRSFTFDYDLNYTGADREALVVFKNEQYNLTDTVKVVSVGEGYYLRAEKKKYHVVNQSIQSLSLNLSTNVPDEDFSEIGIDIVGNGSTWLHVLENYGSSILFSYDKNMTGVDREATIIICSKKNNESDTIKVIHHAAQLGNLSTWHTTVCQPTGDILEIPVTGLTENIGIIVSGNEYDTDTPLYSFMHRLSDEVRDGNTYIRLQIDANKSEQSRDYTSYDAHFYIKVGDARPCNFGFYQPGIDAPSFNDQKEALKVFYQSTNGDHWKNNSNWLSEKPINEWYGINNDIWGEDTIIGNYIYKIDLTDNEIIGDIPVETSILLWAKKFFINNNGLYGTIPNAVKQHPKWNEWNWGWTIIQQNPYFSSGKLFDAHDFNLKSADSEVLLFVEDRTTTFYDLLKQNEYTLVFNSGIDDDFVNLYLDYCNKGLGVITEHIIYEGDTWDEHISKAKSLQAKGFPTGIKWINKVYMNSDFCQLGEIYLLNKDGNLIQYWGKDFSIPITWYLEQVRNVLQPLLGEPEQHEPYGDLYTSTDYTRDGEVMTLQTATIGKGIDIVLMGDAYVDQDIASGKYEQDMRQGMEQFFSDEVYAALRERFNVYAVTVISPNRTTSNGGLWKLNYDDNICLEYAQRVSNVDLNNVTIINIVNNDNPNGMKGHANMYEGIGVAHIEEGGPTELIIHEAGGHAFAKLADEYILGGYGANRCPEDQLEAFKQWIDESHAQGMFANVSATNDPAQVPWAHLLKDERYKDEVGIYQGAWMWPYDLWRASENSVMNTEDYHFNAPSREAIYKRVMKLSEGDSWVYNFEDFATFDAPIREAYKKQNAARRVLQREQNTSRKRIESRPPTIYKGTWRDAGKCEKVEYVSKTPLNQ